MELLEALQESGEWKEAHVTRIVIYCSTRKYSNRRNDDTPTVQMIAPEPISYFEPRITKQNLFASSYFTIW